MNNLLLKTFFKICPFVFVCVCMCVIQCETDQITLEFFLTDNLSYSLREVLYDMKAYYFIIKCIIALRRQL